MAAIAINNLENDRRSKSPQSSDPLTSGRDGQVVIEWTLEVIVASDDEQLSNKWSEYCGV